MLGTDGSGFFPFRCSNCPLDNCELNSFLFALQKFDENPDVGMVAVNSMFHAVVIT